MPLLLDHLPLLTPLELENRPPTTVTDSLEQLSRQLENTLRKVAAADQARLSNQSSLYEQNVCSIPSSFDYDAKDTLL